MTNPRRHQVPAGGGEDSYHKGTKTRSDTKTIIDAERALLAADAADDDEEADASRAMLQQALADTAGAVAALDHAVEKAATAWGITGIPGTKVAVADLPDLGGAAAAIAVVPLLPGPATAPAAAIVPAVDRTGFHPGGHRDNCSKTWAGIPS